ncbi:hypothetical protein BLNAU_19580 [Blattamonas nauphoetae]|uniref:Uncharacterized protein n=1 Tax=Blattamonas nauphoetae TaxID=2049346 RepID=A0ABQ9X3I6_9EUKA|nr:hypothetical protein BLNAU_19580 [Blattamonas nauphoetae]
MLNEALTDFSLAYSLLHRFRSIGEMNGVNSQIFLESNINRCLSKIQEDSLTNTKLRSQNTVRPGPPPFLELTKSSLSLPQLRSTVFSTANWKRNEGQNIHHYSSSQSVLTHLSTAQNLDLDEEERETKLSWNPYLSYSSSRLNEQRYVHVEKTPPSVDDPVGGLNQGISDSLAQNLKQTALKLSLSLYPQLQFASYSIALRRKDAQSSRESPDPFAYSSFLRSLFTPLFIPKSVMNPLIPIPSLREVPEQLSLSIVSLRSLTSLFNSHRVGDALMRLITPSSVHDPARSLTRIASPFVQLILMSMPPSSLWHISHSFQPKKRRRTDFDTVVSAAFFERREFSAEQPPTHISHPLSIMFSAQQKSRRAPHLDQLSDLLQILRDLSQLTAQTPSRHQLHRQIFRLVKNICFILIQFCHIAPLLTALRVLSLILTLRFGNLGSIGWDDQSHPTRSPQRTLQTPHSHSTPSSCCQIDSTAFSFTQYEPGFFDFLRAFETLVESLFRSTDGDFQSPFSSSELQISLSEESEMWFLYGRAHMRLGVLLKHQSIAERITRDMKDPPCYSQHNPTHFPIILPWLTLPDETNNLSSISHSAPPNTIITRSVFSPLSHHHSYRAPLTREMRTRIDSRLNPSLGEASCRNSDTESESFDRTKWREERRRKQDEGRMWQGNREDELKQLILEAIRQRNQPCPPHRAYFSSQQEEETFAGSVIDDELQRDSLEELNVSCEEILDEDDSDELGSRTDSSSQSALNRPPSSISPNLSSSLAPCSSPLSICSESPPPQLFPSSQFSGSRPHPLSSHSQSPFPEITPISSTSPYPSPLLVCPLLKSRFSVNLLSKEDPPLPPTEPSTNSSPPPVPNALSSSGLFLFSRSASPDVPLSAPTSPTLLRSSFLTRSYNHFLPNVVPFVTVPSVPATPFFDPVQSVPSLRESFTPPLSAPTSLPTSQPLLTSPRSSRSSHRIPFTKMKREQPFRYSEDRSADSDEDQSRRPRKYKQILRPKPKKVTFRPRHPPRSTHWFKHRKKRSENAEDTQPLIPQHPLPIGKCFPALLPRILSLNWTPDPLPSPEALDPTETSPDRSKLHDKPAFDRHFDCAQSAFKISSYLPTESWTILSLIRSHLPRPRRTPNSDPETDQRLPRHEISRRQAKERADFESRVKDCLNSWTRPNEMARDVAELAVQHSKKEQLRFSIIDQINSLALSFHMQTHDTLPFIRLSLAILNTQSISLRYKRNVITPDPKKMHTASTAPGCLSIVVPALSNLALFFQLTGRADEAQSCFRVMEGWRYELKKPNTRSAQLSFLVNQSLVSPKGRQSQKRDLKTVWEWFPSTFLISVFPHVFHNYAVFLSSLHDLGSHLRSLSVLIQLLQTHPSFWEGWNTLGVLLAEHGCFNDARMAVLVAKGMLVQMEAVRHQMNLVQQRQSSLAEFGEWLTCHFGFSLPSSTVQKEEQSDGSINADEFSVDNPNQAPFVTMLNVHLNNFQVLSSLHSLPSQLNRTTPPLDHSLIISALSHPINFAPLVPSSFLREEWKDDEWSELFAVIVGIGGGDVVSPNLLD